jgi:hypothetical protein
MNSKFKLSLGLVLGSILFAIPGNTQVNDFFGLFYIRAMHSDSCLHNPDGSQRNNVLVTQWRCIVQPNVQWSINYVGSNNYVWIKNAASDKCLRVKEASLEEYAPIVQYDCNNNYRSEQWALIPVRNGYYYIKNRYSGKCIHVHGASQLNGAQITQRRCEDRPNILWKYR